MYTVHCTVIIPLTTNAESYSDLRESFTSDSSNLFKNKRFLHEFVSFDGYKDIRILCFFLFLTVWTYFLSKYCEHF